MVLFNHEIFSAFNTYIPLHTHTRRPSHAHTLQQVGCARVRVLRQKFLLLAAQNKQNQTERNKVDKYLPMYTLSYIHTYRTLLVYVYVCVWSVGKAKRVAHTTSNSATIWWSCQAWSAAKYATIFSTRSTDQQRDRRRSWMCSACVCVCCIQCRLCNSTIKEFCSCRCLRKCLSLFLYVSIASASRSFVIRLLIACHQIGLKFY